MMHFLRLCNNISFIGKLLLFCTSYFQRFEERFATCILPCGELSCSPSCDFCVGRSPWSVSWSQPHNTRMQGLEGRVWLPTSSAQGLPQPYWIVFVHPPPPLDHREGSPPATNFNLLSSCHTYRFSSLWGPAHFSELVALLIF